MKYEFTIRRPDDLHVHLREGEMLKDVLPHTVRSFGRALIMPNTTKPILTAEDLRIYREIIITESKDIGYPSFEPLMTIQLTEKTTRKTARNAWLAGAVAAKVYPFGLTTNSEYGVWNYAKLYPVLAFMESIGMIVSLHGEAPGSQYFCLDREKAFLKILEDIVLNFPKLKIVLEHLTTSDAVSFVEDGPDTLAATITVHHLYLTLNDIIDSKLHPHYFCKPVAKRPEDRKALVRAVLSDNPKFFFGSDSAPHLRCNKEATNGCAGIFTAPIAIPLLMQFFDEHNALDRFEKFVSVYGAKFYGLPLNEEYLTLVQKTWRVPKEYNGIVPFKADTLLNWQIALN